MAKKKAVKKAAETTGEKPMKKSTAVREIMATGVTDIKEIQRQVQEKYGLEVGYQNVYMLLKSGGKSGSAQKSTAKKPAMKANGADAQLDTLAAGVQFIKSAGGIEQAKAVLRTIEDIRSI